MGWLATAVGLGTTLLAGVTCWHYVGTHADRRLEILANLARSPIPEEAGMKAVLRALLLRAVRERFFPINGAWAAFLAIVFAGVGAVMAAIGLPLIFTAIPLLGWVVFVEGSALIAMAFMVAAGIAKRPKKDEDHIREWLEELEKDAFEKQRPTWQPGDKAPASEPPSEPGVEGRA